MEEEIQYLSYKMDELKDMISYYDREVSKTESEQKRIQLNSILEAKRSELEILQNIHFKIR